VLTHDLTIFSSLWSTEVHGQRNKLGGWVSVIVSTFSSNDISRLRRPKNVKFDTKVASSKRMMHALRLLESFLAVAKIGQKRQKGAHSSPQATSETKNNRNAENDTNIAHGVRMTSELCF